VIRQREPYAPRRPGNEDSSRTRSGSAWTCPGDNRGQLPAARSGPCAGGGPTDECLVYRTAEDTRLRRLIGRHTEFGWTAPGPGPGHRVRQRNAVLIEAADHASLVVSVGRTNRCGETGGEARRSAERGAAGHCRVIGRGSVWGLLVRDERAYQRALGDAVCVKSTQTSQAHRNGWPTEAVQQRPDEVAGGPPVASTAARSRRSVISRRDRSTSSTRPVVDGRGRPPVRDVEGAGGSRTRRRMRLRRAGVDGVRGQLGASIIRGRDDPPAVAPGSRPRACPVVDAEVRGRGPTCRSPLMKAHRPAARYQSIRSRGSCRAARGRGSAALVSTSRRAAAR
jgi:hypothetical protein